MRNILTLIAIVSIASAINAVEANDAQCTQPRTSCIKGTATESPTRPVPTSGEPTSRPLPGAHISIRMSEEGKEIAHTRTDASGRFRVEVPPGRYIVVGLPPSPKKSLPKGESVTTVVNPNVCTDVKVSFDTGIR